MRFTTFEKLFLCLLKPVKFVAKIGFAFLDRRLRHLLPAFGEQLGLLSASQLCAAPLPKLLQQAARVVDRGVSFEFALGLQSLPRGSVARVFLP